MRFYFLGAGRASDWNTTTCRSSLHNRLPFIIPSRVTATVDDYLMRTFPLPYQADPPLLKCLATNSIDSSTASRSATLSPRSIAHDDRQCLPELIVDDRCGTRRSCARPTLFPGTCHALRARRAAMTTLDAIMYVLTHHCASHRRTKAIKAK